MSTSNKPKTKSKATAKTVTTVKTPNTADTANVAKPAKPAKPANQPVYKQWWFWVIIVVALMIIGIIGSGGKLENPNTNTNTGTNSSNQSSSSETPQEESNGTASESGSEVYKVGGAIVLKNQTVSVNSVQRNYSTGNPYVMPKDGKEYVKVNISVTNTSNSKRYFSAGDWKMQDGDGVIDTYNFTATAMLGDPLDSLVELASGGKTSGSLVFEVPEGDNKLELQYKASLLKTIVIKL